MPGFLSVFRLGAQYRQFFLSARHLITEKFILKLSSFYSLSINQLAISIISFRAQYLLVFYFRLELLMSFFFKDKKEKKEAKKEKDAFVVRLKYFIIFS
jgi:hypothetical protein